MARKKFYCIDYRNMHTAIHGLIIFETRRKAEEIYAYLKKNIRKLEISEVEDDFTYEDIVNIAFNASVGCIDEINFRDIKEKQLYGRLQKVYSDDYIIVNLCALDLYL